MQSGSNPSLGFSFGPNAATPASSASSTPAGGFSFDSANTMNPSSGFNFGAAATTAKSGFSFSTPATNTAPPAFGTPTTNPPAYGTQATPGMTGSTFGIARTTTTGLQFGTTGSGIFNSTPQTVQNTGGFGQHTTQSMGLFSGSMAPASQASGTSLFSAKLPTNTGMSQPGTTPQTTQNLGGFGQQMTQSTGLFSGSMAPASQASGTSLFSGKLPTNTGISQLGGTTTFFSGAAPAVGKPSFNVGGPTQAKPSGISFGSLTQATQATTMANAAPFSSTATSLGTNPGLTFGTQETVTAAKPGFSFGTATTPASSGSTLGTGQTTGITFGGSAPTTKPSSTATPGTTGFTLGGTPTTTIQAGATTQTGVTSTGFKLGGTPGTTAQVPGTGFKLGATPTATQPGVKLGGAPATQTTPGFSFGTNPSSAQATAQPVQGLALGQSTTGFNFSGQLGGQPKTVATTTVASTAAKPSTIGTNTNLVFAAKVKSTLPGATPSLTTTTSTAKPTFGLTIPQTSASTGFQLGGAPTATSTASGFKLPTSTTIAGLTSKAATSGTTTTATSSEKYTYKQLEEQVNKWNIELENMEKSFLEQASQVNVTDRELMENGEKIAVLNNEVERAKAEQNRLDQELDFLVSQQNELEDLLKPLEESVKQHNTEYAQEPDRERGKIYTMAEKCDGQLKGMVQDLREIIDYLNSTNANQQQEDNPVIQIAKILNVHMDSLQWIDQNSALLQKRVDEIARLSEMRRKDHERSFRLGFD